MSRIFLWMHRMTWVSAVYGLLSVILLGFANISAFAAANEVDNVLFTQYQLGALSYHEYLVYHGYLYFAPERLREVYPQGLNTRRGNCATPAIVEIQQNWDILTPEEQKEFQGYFARPWPRPPHNIVTPSGFFKIHYYTSGRNSAPDSDENANGLPDLVDAAVEAADKALETYRSLGYRYPVGDRGADGPEFDIYIVDLTDRKIYGETYLPPDVYIKIDNDFEGSIYYTQGADGARVTVAHELHHAVQFAYRYAGLDVFFLEATSVYFEDVVYPNINDYLQYLPRFFEHHEYPFNKRDNWHEYGLSIFNHFMEKRFDATVLRTTWEEIGRGTRAIDALDYALQTKNSDFAASLGEFYTWNYFTGVRADTVRFYPEGHLYPTLSFNETISITSDTTIEIENSYLSPYYVFFEDIFPARYDFQVTPEDGLELWENNLIYDPYGEQGSILEFSPSGVSAEQTVTSSATQASILFVPVSTAVYPNNEPGSWGKYKTELSVTITTTGQYDTDRLMVNYPNPFILGEYSETTIPFSLAEEGDVDIYIFTAAGRLVKKMSLGTQRSGFHPADLKWNGTDEGGNHVSSGIYICQMKVKDNTVSQKIAVIR